MNTGLDSTRKTFNGSKYYFKILENNKWKVINRAFCLNIENNTRLYGQFITSNWFQIPVDINCNYQFKLVSITTGDNHVTEHSEFKLSSETFQNHINNINNNYSNINRITLHNAKNTFSLNFREHIQNEKKMYLISLPEFTLNLE